ncbi:MAG: hypothetical protein KKH68_01205 [Proteobacteria bacterium]|nr:hypothetical protein [Pseudomonadota bacterium]
MKAKSIFFTKASGAVKAILNWRTRTDEDAVLLSDTFDTEEMDLYQDFKDAGKDDQFIFEKFFPPKETIKAGSQKVSDDKKEGTFEVAIDINRLTKIQLAFLIERQIKTPLSTLGNMSKEDLVKLFLELID